MEKRVVMRVTKKVMANLRADTEIRKCVASSTVHGLSQIAGTDENQVENKLRRLFWAALCFGLVIYLIVVIHLSVEE